MEKYVFILQSTLYKRPIIQIIALRCLNNSYIYKNRGDKIDLNPSCKHCNKTEDNLRLFTTCNRAQKIWSYFQKTYHKLSKQQYTPRQHILTLSSNNTNPKNKKLILTLTQIIIYELSLSRNKLKFEGIHLT